MNESKPSQSKIKAGIMVILPRYASPWRLLLRKRGFFHGNGSFRLVSGAGLSR
jgi:hypothetical protein